VFGTELQTMIESGAGLVLGTAGEGGAPRGIRAWSASVVDGPVPRIRVVLSADDPVALENIGGGRVSLTAADVRTFRSVQLKGRVTCLEAPTDADVEVARNQTDRFFAAVHETDGNPIELLERLLPVRRMVVEIDVDEQYDQTPGPGAGATLRAPQ
jgi:hypothetical protein